MINFYESTDKQTRTIKQLSSRGWGQPFRFGRRVALLAFLLIPAAFCARAQAASLTWTSSSDPSLAGYNLYYGGASGNYTNVVSVGKVTTASVSGLMPGRTYYFAATAVDASGAESSYSAEISYTVPATSTNSTSTASLILNASAGGGFQLTCAGQPSHTYEILASTNLINWVVLGSQQAGANGSFQFTDSQASQFHSRFYRTLDTQN